MLGRPFLSSSGTAVLRGQANASGFSFSVLLPLPPDMGAVVGSAGHNKRNKGPAF